MSDLEAVVRWYAVLTLVAAALFPAFMAVTATLDHARFGLLRPLSLVALTAIVWWPAAAIALPFSTVVLAVALAIFGTAGWLWWQRSGFTGWDRQQLATLAAFEGAWLALFLLYAWFRAYHPDIANTEKPMEIGLLTSTSRSNDVPAPDVWLAGSSINYYYFGYQTMASIVKLSAVPTATAFNLALATLFASTATVGASLGAYLTRSLSAGRRPMIAAGMLAAMLLVLAGNMETSQRLADDARSTIDAGWWDGVGWQASRIVIDRGVNQPGDEKPTINEFPAFSFVLGDLHPHVLTLPLLGVVVALALALTPDGSRRYRAQLIVLGSGIGLLYASNSWDAPAGLLVALAVVAVRRRVLKAVALDATIVMVTAGIACAPFLLTFDAPLAVSNPDVPNWISQFPVIGTLANTLGIVTWRPSSTRELLTVHGAWIGAFALFAVVEVQSDRRYFRWIADNRHGVLTVGALCLGVAVAWAPAVLLIGVPLVMAAWIAVSTSTRTMSAVAILFAGGFALVLVPEFVYIQDVFGDRMNTVFKLYFQAWLMLSVASAAALVSVVTRAPIALRPGAAAASILLVMLTAPYTPLSAQDWTNGFNQRVGLNGEAYIGRASPDELAAIEWVRTHAGPDDTIVEAPGCAYWGVDGVPMSRISSFAGVPTIVGWPNHEGQWRRGEDEQIGERLTALSRRANEILSGNVPAVESGARLLILGGAELRGAATCREVAERDRDVVVGRLADAGWVPVFETGGVTIYAQPRDPLTEADR